MLTHQFNTQWTEGDASADAAAINLRSLAAAVIMQAIEDMRKKASPQDVARARAFLTSEDDEWKEARDIWCDAAGLDGDVVRERALNDFPKPKPPPKPRKKTADEVRAERFAAIEAAGLDWRTCSVVDAARAFTIASLRVEAPRNWLRDRRVEVGLPPPPRTPRKPNTFKIAPAKPKTPKIAKPNSATLRIAALEAAGIDWTAADTINAAAELLGMTYQQFYDWRYNTASRLGVTLERIRRDGRWAEREKAVAMNRSVSPDAVEDHYSDGDGQHTEGCAANGVKRRMKNVLAPRHASPVLSRVSPS